MPSCSVPKPSLSDVSDGLLMTILVPFRTPTPCLAADSSLEIKNYFKFREQLYFLLIDIQQILTHHVAA